MSCPKCERYHNMPLIDITKCVCICHKVLNGKAISQSGW